MGGSAAGAVGSGSVGGSWHCRNSVGGSDGGSLGGTVVGSVDGTIVGSVGGFVGSSVVDSVGGSDFLHRILLPTGRRHQAVRLFQYIVYLRLSLWI